MESKPKITAKTVEEFNKICEKLETLPDCIVSQIDTADNGLMGIECIFKRFFDKDRKIYIPDFTTQIHDFGDYIGIYSDDFFFKSPKGNNISFILIECKK